MEKEMMLKYVDNIYSRRYERDITEQLYGFAVENGFDINLVRDAIVPFEDEPEGEGWSKSLSRIAIFGMVNYIVKNG
jgi:hypothetical protein